MKTEKDVKKPGKRLLLALLAGALLFLLVGLVVGFSALLRGGG